MDLISSTSTGSYLQVSPMTQLTFGVRADFHDRGGDYGISGFIIEQKTWSASEIAAQAAKGPYYDF